MSFTLSVQFSTDCVDVEFIYSVISLKTVEIGVYSFENAKGGK